MGHRRLITPFGVPQACHPPAEHIVQATYLQGTGDLQIFIINKTDRALHTLHGQEAADAVKILRKLKG